MILAQPGSWDKKRKEPLVRCLIDPNPSECDWLDVEVRKKRNVVEAARVRE